MRIAFLVNHVFDGWTPNDERLGGTEEGIVNWSRILARDHEVTVFQNGYEGTDQGVEYRPREQYPTHDFDVTFNHKALDMPVIGRTFYFTTETDADAKDLSGYEAVVWPSQWAADHIKVNNPNVKVIGYGYDPTHIYPQAKIPKTVLYASSPDRGLDTLLEVWPSVVQSHPDAMLIVTYGAQPRDVPNTLFMGSVDEQTMDDLYRTSDIWCHPANGGELFGITAVKAQAAGCVPVYFPTMALRETVQTGVVSSPGTLQDDLIRTLGDETLKAAIRETMATKTYPTWESTAKELLALVV